jgi:hypothetical protein
MSFQYRKNLLSFAALAFHRQKPSRYGFVEAFFTHSQPAGGFSA